MKQTNGTATTRITPRPAQDLHRARERAGDEDGA